MSRQLKPGPFITPKASWFVDGLAMAWQYIPLAIPVALATVIGGIDNTESATVAGDRYDTRSILLVEGGATLIASLCGGVIQNTPYIGHPAYKDMGSRAAYTLATGLFIGVGAATGVVEALIAILPESVVVPVLIFVGLEMAEQAMAASEARHLKAVAIALIPTIANLVNIEMGTLIGAARIDLATLPTDIQRGIQVMTMLGNGFIVSAMIWATWLVWTIDRRLGAAALLCVAAAALTSIGLMHSPYSDGRLFMPWQNEIPVRVHVLTIAYLALGLLCAALAMRNGNPREA